MDFDGKRFYSLNTYLQKRYGGKVIKIPLDGGFTCPNRDGVKGVGGCIFCGNSGSGEFTGGAKLSIPEQFTFFRESVRKKWPDAKYIPYFQAYSSTYGTVESLREKYNEALLIEDSVALSIATRPDCLSDEILFLLEEIGQRTDLFVELGLQTANEKTAAYINRAYENHDYEKAVHDLRTIGANVVTHIIAGLPGENKDDFLNTVSYAVHHKTQGVKLHLLYILKNTEIARQYAEGLVKETGFDDYVDMVVSAIEILPKDVVIHRLTGDGKRDEIIAPLFSIQKFELLNAINRELCIRDSWQGKLAWV